MDNERYGTVVFDLTELLFECTQVRPEHYQAMAERGYINEDVDPLIAMEDLVLELMEGTLSQDDLIEHNDHVLGEILPADRTPRDRMFVEIGDMAVKHLCPWIADNYHLQGISTHEATLTVELFQPQDPDWLWSEERRESTGL